MKFNDFNEKLIYWYKGNYRSLPWRGIRDPYRIWLSEIILQQTRVNQGLPYYLKFIDKYPTINDLASASEQEVLRLWQGLGYYSRARNLMKAANKVTREYQGKFPDNYSELLKLPGIGKYTAAAIASFAFKEKVAVVDGNVYRVIARIFGVDMDISSSRAHEHFKGLSEQLIPDQNPDLYNQAIMELGATICTPRAPECHSCIFNSVCHAYEYGVQQNLPVKTGKVKVKDRKFYYLILYNNEGCLMKCRSQNDIWTGMYDFLWIDTANFDDLNSITKMNGLSNVLNDAGEIYNTTRIRHILSHQRLETGFVNIHIDQLPESLNVNGQQLTFFHWDDIPSLPKPVLVDNYLKSQSFIR